MTKVATTRLLDKGFANRPNKGKGGTGTQMDYVTLWSGTNPLGRIVGYGEIGIKGAETLAILSEWMSRAFKRIPPRVSGLVQWRFAAYRTTTGK